MRTLPITDVEGFTNMLPGQPVYHGLGSRPFEEA